MTRQQLEAIASEATRHVVQIDEWWAGFCEDEPPDEEAMRCCDIARSALSRLYRRMKRRLREEGT